MLCQSFKKEGKRTVPVSLASVLGNAVEGLNWQMHFIVNICKIILFDTRNQNLMYMVLVF